MIGTPYSTGLNKNRTKQASFIGPRHKKFSELYGANSGPGSGPVYAKGAHEETYIKKVAEDQQLL